MNNVYSLFLKYDFLSIILFKIKKNIIYQKDHLQEFDRKTKTTISHFSFC